MAVVVELLQHVVMIAAILSLALLFTLNQYLLAGGLGATVLTVYEQLAAVAFLACLLPFFERNKRPPMSVHYLSGAFLIGVLQVSIGELLGTLSLKYISVSIQSVSQNMVPVVVLVLAVLAGREQLALRTPNGFAKLSGILVSTAGATIMVLASGSTDPGSDPVGASRAWWLGCLFCLLAVFGLAGATMTMDYMAMRYPADLTLSTLIVVFGTIQTFCISLFTERDPSSWKISWSKKLQFLIILYGGIVATGLGYIARIWVIRMKGPVFVTAYSPLLIVFSFILQMVVDRALAKFWSIGGALMVVIGLYLVLWAKSKEDGEARIKSSSADAEPLLVGEI